VRELRRLLVEPERLASGPTLTLTAEEGRYLGRVLRYGAGQRLAVGDGVGHLWSAVLLDGQRARLEQPLDRPLESQPPPDPLLVLAVAVPRLDFDVLVRMACELGVDRLQPLIAEHGAVRGSWKPDRWRAILREACEQCERLWQPRLLEPRDAVGWLTAPPEGLTLLAATREPDLPLLGRVLPQGSQEAVSLTAVTLAIGAEGGWSVGEADAARVAGWRRVSLGPRILRTSTAAVSGLAALAEWRAATHHT
jgi:16S rRNA (uracil1498-N3)-methyltransferase